MAAVVAVLAVVAATLGGGRVDGSSPTDEVDRDAELVFAIQFGLNSLDPHRTPSSQADAIWMRPVYDRLLAVGRDADGNAELQPQLVTEYEVAEDGLTITLDLRDDVTFHSGAPFDGDVVKANVVRAKDEESTVSSLFTNVDEVEVVSPTQVGFHLSSPDPALLWNLATGSAGMMVDPAAFDTDLSTQPAGSGPFTLVSSVKDAETVYERWDDYWDPDAALVETLTLSTIFEVSARYNGTQADEFDAAFLVPPAEAPARELESEGYTWHQELGPIANGVLINTDQPPFDDVRVRRALTMAINKDEIAQSLTDGVSPTVTQPFPAGFLGNDPDLAPIEYDPEGARALLEEAGATGAEITLIQQVPQEPQTSMALVVQQAWNDIGLEVEVLPLSTTEARPAWRDGSAHAMVGPIINGFDPGQTLTDTYLGGDMPGTPPAELVEMADAALVLPFGSDEREAAYQEISAYLTENPIHIPILQFSSVNLSRPEVVNAERLMVFQIGQLDFRGVGIAAS